MKIEGTWAFFGRLDYEHHGRVRTELMPCHSEGRDEYMKAFNRAAQRGERFRGKDLARAVRDDKRGKRAYAAPDPTPQSGVGSRPRLTAEPKRRRRVDAGW